jgi:hypothetical protein
MNSQADLTAISSYQLVFETDGTDTEPTAFPIGVKSGDIDLLSDIWGERGKNTEAVRLAFLFTGMPSGIGTIIMTGACEGGPEEYICQIDATIGTVVETGDWRWVDDAIFTNFHLAGYGIHIADKGNGHPTKVGFDALSYRYIRFYSKDFVTTTNMRIYARYF